MELSFIRLIFELGIYFVFFIFSKFNAPLYWSDALKLKSRLVTPPHLLSSGVLARLFRFIRLHKAVFHHIHVLRIIGRRDERRDRFS